MTTTATFCTFPACPVPVNATTLCTDHHADLVKHLRHVPWLVDELRNVRTRQTRYSTMRSRAKNDRSPMLYDTRGADLATRLETRLATWQAAAADYLGEPVRYPSPVTASRYLLRALDDGRLHAWVDAGKLLDTLADLHTSALVAINPAEDQWAAGPCNAQTPNPDGTVSECGAGLYAIVGRPTVTCRKCGAEYAVDQRRAWLLENADNEEVTISVAVRALVTLVDGVSDADKLHARIRQWASRNQLLPMRHTWDGETRHAIYRFGDIRDMLSAALHRDQQRTLNRKNTTRRSA